MDLRAFLNDHFTSPMSWPLAAGVGLLVVLALEVLYRLVFGWLKAVSRKTSTPLDDVLLRRMRLPAQVLVVLVGAHVLFSARGVENALVSKAVTLVELLLVAHLVIEACQTAGRGAGLHQTRRENANQDRAARDPGQCTGPARFSVHR